MYNLVPLFLRILEEFPESKFLELAKATPFHRAQFQVFLTLRNRKSHTETFGLILEHGKKWGKQKSSVMIASLSSTQLGTCQNASHAHYYALIICHITDNDNNWNDWASWFKKWCLYLYLKLGHDHFHPHNFQFIICYISLRYAECY